MKWENLLRTLHHPYCVPTNPTMIDETNNRQSTAWRYYSARSFVWSLVEWWSALRRKLCTYCDEQHRLCEMTRRSWIWIWERVPYGTRISTLRFRCVFAFNDQFDGDFWNRSRSLSIRKVMTHRVSPPSRRTANLGMWGASRNGSEAREYEQMAIESSQNRPTCPESNSLQWNTSHRLFTPFAKI